MTEKRKKEKRVADVKRDYYGEFMNREQARILAKKYKAEFKRLINSDTEAVLAAGAEYFNLPLDWMKIRYVDHRDKGKFITDIKYMVEMIKTEQYEFDRNHNFVKVDTE